MLQIMCELEAAVTEREAMVAENELRGALGQSIAYDEQRFFALSETMMHLAERTRNL